MTEPGPQRRLGRTARTLWRLEGLATTATAAVAAAVAASLVGRGWFSALAWAAVVLVAVAVIGVAPELRWRRWRWDVGEDDVEIRSGTLTVRHTIVPLRRVQHVDTQRGILEPAQLDRPVAGTTLSEVTPIGSAVWPAAVQPASANTKAGAKMRRAAIMASSLVWCHPL